MTAFSPRITTLLVALALMSATLILAVPPAAAQQDQPQADSDAGADPAPGDGDAPPTMAEIERAWQAGDFALVRKGLKHLAETEGTALAQYRYGRVLAEGRGGPRDIQAAIKWLQQAVDQNNDPAAVLLARIYLSAKNEGAPQAAAGLLERAAARGHPEGQYYLALLHQKGHGVEKDPVAAFNWLLAASEQGFISAQFDLARAYSRGDGTRENPEEAAKWLTEAASSGHIQAQFFLANALDSGRGMAQDRLEALNWYRRAAEAGHVVAQRELGLRYLEGEATPRDVDEGLRWLVPAAKAGEAGAQMALGDGYAGLRDYGLPPNDAEAVTWYRHADAQTYPPAMVALARMQETGRGMPQDLAAAVDHYRRTLRETGYAPAALRLGQLAAEGRLGGLVAPHLAVPWVVLAAKEGHDGAVTWLEIQAEGDNRPARTALALILQDQGGDEARIATLLTGAAEDGDVEAQFRLGGLFATGSGVELDYAEAHKWFNIAAAQGHSQAAEQRATVSKLMTPEEIAAAQAAARAWFEQEANRAPETDQQVTTSTGRGSADD